MRVILFLLAAGALQQLQAQVKEENGSRYALKAGLIYSAMNFNAGIPAPPVTVKNSWKPGFYFGGSLQFPVTSAVSLQPEYAYMLKQGYDERIGTAYKLQYLSLPLLLKIAVREKLALLAGPEFGILIRANQEKSSVSLNTTHDTEERSISIAGGAELNITRSLFAELRYQHGLNHIGLGQRSSTTEFKWRSASLGLGWKW